MEIDFREEAEMNRADRFARYRVRAKYFGEDEAKHSEECWDTLMLTDKEWQGILQRAIERVEGWDTPAWYKAWPLRKLRGELRMVDARVARVQKTEAGPSSIP